MSGSNRAGKSEELMGVMLESLEALLALTIIVLVAVNGLKLLYTATFESLREAQVDKQTILHVLDIALLLILSVDILRTLITAIRARFLPIRIVVEAAMIAVLRELISIEIRHLDYPMVFTLTIAIVGLGIVWILIYSVERRAGTRYA